jgi:hypothetical protein
MPCSCYNTIRPHNTTPFNVGTWDDAAHQEALLDADILPQHRATVQLAFW